MNFKLLHGDSTKIPVDAIVNAANSNLLGGGGIDGAILREGGFELVDIYSKLIDEIGIIPVGKAAITKAGKLPAKYIIHTVGPVWKGGEFNEKILLKEAYISALKIAVDFNLKIISFPNISTGIYGFPKELAADIAIDTVFNFVKKFNIFNEIIFVCFDKQNFEIYSRKLKLIP